MGTLTIQISQAWEPQNSRCLFSCPMLSGFMDSRAENGLEAQWTSSVMSCLCHVFDTI